MAEITVTVAYDRTEVLELTKITAHGLKKQMGCDPKNDYLFVRMNKHEYVKPAKGVPACKCFYCLLYTKGEWERKGWMRYEPGGQFWRWTRCDISRRNVRFEPEEGEVYVIVREEDFDYWANAICQNYPMEGHHPLGWYGRQIMLPLFAERAGIKESEERGAREDVTA